MSPFVDTSTFSEPEYHLATRGARAWRAAGRRPSLTTLAAKEATMGSFFKRTWPSRDPTGRRVRRVAWGYTLQVNGKQQRRCYAE